MRHRKSRYRLNRSTSWRRSTLKSLARNLLIEQRIKTTVHKAKAARPLIEGLITLAKLNTLSAKRKAQSLLNNDHRLVSRLFNEIGPRFIKRTGGYTRIINLGPRRGDNAWMVIFELTEIKEKPAKKPKKEKEAKVAGPAEEAAKFEKPGEEKKPEEKKPKKTEAAVKEKPPLEKKKKPSKPFFGGIKNIFKKERDSL